MADTAPIDDPFQVSGDMAGNNSKLAACAHHWNIRTDPTDMIALQKFLICLNDSTYLSAFEATKDVLTGTRDRELPILASIIGIYALFILFGVFGNGMVVYAVCHNSQMRTARNLFIVNLAVSDFILCAVTQPLNILRLFQTYISWEYGLTLCKIVNMLTGVNMFVSTFSITAVAVDRFRVIVYPTRTQISQLSLIICLLCIWGTACLVASPLAVFATIADNHLMNPPVRLCSERAGSWKIHFAKMVFSSASMVVQYLLPLGIVSAAYVVIYRRLKQRARQTKERRALTASSAVAAEREAVETARQRRATAQLVAISVVFALSWLPLSVVNIVHDWRVLSRPLKDSVYAGPGKQQEVQIQSGDSTFLVVASQCIPLLLVLVSACLNPVFYGWFNENFQSEFQRIANRLTAACRGLCGRRRRQGQQRQPAAGAPAAAAANGDIAMLTSSPAAVPLVVVSDADAENGCGGGRGSDDDSGERVRVLAEVSATGPSSDAFAEGLV